MSAYYNEIEPFAADWLRRLIAKGLIAPGDVDTRSIIDVRPDDLRSYTQCHFFAGIGGWSYALRSAGWDDDRSVWTGSCPCQPFSLAGKQKGFDDARHLWPVWRDLIRECDPAVVFGEQVASATEWLGLVRSDLEAMGRAVGAMPIQAASAGADHLRDRYWFVAHTELPEGKRQRRNGGEILSEQAAGRHHSAGNLGPDGGSGLAFRSVAEVERGNVRVERPAAAAPNAGSLALANSDSAPRGRSARDAELRSGTEAVRERPTQSGRCSSAVNLADSQRVERSRERLSEQQERDHADTFRSDGSSELSWVTGADGKARRVKPGLRLLAHGVPGRVGKLRGFGNAIDPRPAATFIEAADYAMSLRSPWSKSADPATCWGAGSGRTPMKQVGAVTQISATKRRFPTDPAGAARWMPTLHGKIMKVGGLAGLPFGGFDTRAEAIAAGRRAYLTLSQDGVLS